MCIIWVVISTDIIIPCILGMNVYILLVILTIKYRVSNRNIKSLWEFNKGATLQMAGWRKRVKLSHKYIE